MYAKGIHVSMQLGENNLMSWRLNFPQPQFEDKDVSVRPFGISPSYVFQLCKE